MTLGKPNTTRNRNITMATPPRTAPDIARFVNREDRNRQAAHAHIDHRNRTGSQSQNRPEVDAAQQKAHRDERRQAGEERRQLHALRQELSDHDPAG